VAKLVRVNKPYGVLSQFTDRAKRPTLADFVPLREVYVAGRLDFDSEGLVLLTDDGALQNRISHPRHKLEKAYLVQVEGSVGTGICRQLLTGVPLSDGRAVAIQAHTIAAPTWLTPRHPPIADHRLARSSWLEMVLTTGRNRQIRRMLAALGHPVLRLVRIRIGPWSLDDLNLGEWRLETVHLPKSRQSFQRSTRR